MKKWIITNSVLATAALAVVAAHAVTGEAYVAARVSAYVLMFAASALTFSVLAALNDRAERRHLERMRKMRFAYRIIPEHRLVEMEREAMQRQRTPVSDRLDAVLGIG